MPTRDTAWPDGSPCWVDISVEDLGSAKRSYGHLFGWDTDDSPGGDEGYVTCLKNGRAAAGIMERTSAEEPSAWLTYLATSDVDATTQRVVEAGGAVIEEPKDVGRGAGRLAVVRDASGGVLALWGAGAHTGFQVFGEPGTVAACVLLTRDLQASRAFYEQVFGYTFGEEQGGLVTFLVDGQPAGAMHQADQLPDGVDAAWNVHFAVASRDATVAMAEMEDDTDILMSFDSPAGPEAVIRGPEGEVFNVTELPDTPPEG